MVIGILIALQINNLNEDIKINSNKEESLKVIQTNLKQEKDRLDFVIEMKHENIFLLENILAENFDFDHNDLFAILTTIED